MSSQRGNVSRTRKQKHVNAIVYKNNKHGDTPKTKVLNTLQFCNVCAHCKNILEWKVKYNKYKMLNAPSKCTQCQQKTVKHAYNILCQPCAEKTEVCAKCGKKEEIVMKAPPTDSEKAQIDAKFQQEIKALSERKRRTFLRYLERMEKKSKKENEEGESTESGDKVQRKNWMEEAEEKLQLLKLQKDKEDGEEEEDWDDFDDFDDESEEDDSSS